MLLSSLRGGDGRFVGGFVLRCVLRGGIALGY